MLRVMYDNIQVAYHEGEVGNFTMVLEEGLHPYYIPLELFPHNQTEIPLLKVVEWLDTLRICIKRGRVV